MGNPGKPPMHSIRQDRRLLGARRRLRVRHLRRQ